ncbi:MAG: hypothetical protein OXH94_14600 [Rhodospirillales bacterium]|nr:hypothetical protein [Rhodospirillales bacterium]
MTISLASLTVGEGSDATYTVVLDTEPAGDVTVTPASGAPDAVSVSGPLTFTVGNWSTAQTVTVTAAEENDADAADESLSISHAVTGYGSVTSAADVQVTVNDDDVVANGIYGSLPNLLRADAANDEAWQAEGLAGDGWVSAGLAILRDGALLGQIELPGREVVETDDSGRELSRYGQPPYSWLLPAMYAVDGERISASGGRRGGEDDLLYMKTVSGAVAVGESLDLVLTDWDGLENRLSMEYGAHYDRPSSLSQWEGTWVLSVGGVSLATFTADAGGILLGQFTPALLGCVLSGSLSIIDAGRNLYGLEVILESCELDEGEVVFHGRYTGFAWLDDADGYIDLEIDDGAILDVPSGGANNVGLLFGISDDNTADSLIALFVRQ